MLHSPDDKFDLSDVEANDTLAEILEVSLGVIEDYGPGTTRIQRLATWLVENLGGERFLNPVVSIMVSNEPQELSKTKQRCMSSDEARDFAAALLHRSDEVETEH